jgi:hypothetical protein
MAEERKAGPPEWRDEDATVGWLRGKTPEDLDIIEFEGRPSYLDSIVRRNPKTGEVQSVPVRIISPSHMMKAKARMDALEWLAKAFKLKERPSWTEGIRLVGEAYLDTLDTVCLVARCTRDHDDPRHPHMHYEELDKYYVRSSIITLWESICQHDDGEDPRRDELGEEEFWTVVKAIEGARNCGPLVAIAGGARDAFVTSMASRLASYQTSKPCWPSTETSTPEK